MGGPKHNQSASCNCGYRAWERGSRQGVASFIRTPCDLSRCTLVERASLQPGLVFGVGSSRPTCILLDAHKVWPRHARIVDSDRIESSLRFDLTLSSLISPRQFVDCSGVALRPN